MTKFTAKFSLAALAAFGSVSGMVQEATAAVVINEIYGGGGFAANGTLPTSAFNRDFVELFNNGAEAVDIGGYAFRYGSAASTSMNPTMPGTLGADVPAGTILPVGGFYLIAAEAGTSTNGAALPFTPDLIASTVNLSGNSGRVGLYASSTATEAIDFLGYGSATAFETAAATGFGGTAAAGVTTLNRTAGVDTQNNSTDFTFAAPTPTTSTVPEPASLGLAAAAGALLIGRRRK